MTSERVDRAAGGFGGLIGPGTFRRRMSEVTAVRLCWRNWSDVCDLIARDHPDWLRDHPARMTSESFRDRCGEEGPEYLEVYIPTLHGVATARHGDWIVRDPDGDLWPVHSDKFLKLYDRC